MTEINFPEGYEPKDWQRLMLPVVTGLLSDSNAVAMDVPTGAGKTSFFLSLAYQTGWRILYLARTKDEFKRPWEDNHRWFKLPMIYLMGKQDLCARPDLWVVPLDDDEDTPREDPCKMCVLQILHKTIDTSVIQEPAEFVRNIVAEAKRGFAADGNAKLYPLDDTVALSRMMKKGAKPKGFCPYYSVRNSLSDARIVLGTYNYALNPSIRKNVFETPMEEEIRQENDHEAVSVIRNNVPEVQNDQSSMDMFDLFDLVIFDEAHNLDSTVENFGRKLSVSTIRNAFRKLFGDTAALKAEKIREYASKYQDSEGTVNIGHILLELFKSLEDVKISKYDHLKRYTIPDHIRKLFIKFPVSFSNLAELTDAKTGRYVNRSLHAVYSFLTELFSLSGSESGVYCEEYESWKPENRGMRLRRLRIMTFNHSQYFTFLRGNRTLFMSGTLPSKEAIELMWGMPEAVYLTPDNAIKIQRGSRNFFKNKGLTTRGASKLPTEDWMALMKNYALRVREIFSKSEKSVVAAFPNGNMASSAANLLKDFPEIGDKCVLPSGPHKAAGVRREMLDGKRVVLTAYNSSLLEGVEFMAPNKDNLLSDVILAGVPIPPPDDYRKDVSEFIFKNVPRKGGVKKEDLLYNEPALISVKQAMGRANRSSRDSVNVWLLDDRFLGPYWENNLWGRN